MTTDVLVVLGGYLLGSIPFGYLLPRLVRGDDVRRHGSGNVGASNVWRIYGPSLGAPVALFDVAKGFVPALVGLEVGVAWLLDARHDPSASDLQMQDLLVESGRPVLAVLTKADKLGRSAQRERTRAIARALALPDDQIQLTSSRTGEGMADLSASILALVGAGTETPAGQKSAPRDR